MEEESSAYGITLKHATKSHPHAEESIFPDPPSSPCLHAPVTQPSRALIPSSPTDRAIGRKLRPQLLHAPKRRPTALIDAVTQDPIKVQGQDVLDSRRAGDGESSNSAGIQGRRREGRSAGVLDFGGCRIEGGGMGGVPKGGRERAESTGEAGRRRDEEEAKEEEGRGGGRGAAGGVGWSWSYHDACCGGRDGRVLASAKDIVNTCVSSRRLNRRRKQPKAWNGSKRRAGTPHHQPHLACLVEEKQGNTSGDNPEAKINLKTSCQSNKINSTRASAKRARVRGIAAGVVKASTGTHDVAQARSSLWHCCHDSLTAANALYTIRNPSSKAP